MTRCGLGKLTLNDLFAQPVGKDIEGRFLYVGDERNPWLLATMDMAAMWRSQCLRWREAVARETGIPAGNIWLHVTQTHTGPEPPDVAKVEEAFIRESVRAVQRVIASAEPAQVDYVVANLDGRFNHNREQYVPGLGGVTVWQGWDFDPDDGRARVEPDAGKMLLMDWLPDLEIFRRPVYFDRPADPLAALVCFRAADASARTLGTLCRFSAHPATVSGATNFQGLMDEFRYHPDWPGYVRDALERAMGGGVAVFVNGPCGNVATNDRLQRGYGAGDAEARRIGEGVANACIERWNATSRAWQDVRLRTPVHTSIDLPIRETVPAHRDEILRGEDFQDERERRWELRKQAIRSGEAADVIKDMTDELQHFEWTDEIITRWINLSDDELRERRMTVDLEAVALNDLIFVGLPGESMTDTCMWLRAQSLGERLIVFDQVNGYHVYLTSAEAYVQGGYSYWCSVVARPAEGIIKRTAMELIQRMR